MTSTPRRLAAHILRRAPVSSHLFMFVIKPSDFIHLSIAQKFPTMFPNYERLEQGPTDSRRPPPLSTSPRPQGDRWQMQQPHHDYHDHRSSSPYGRSSGPPHLSPPRNYSPPPVSPTLKKKRKRADAAQLKVLNETYNRTAFPSTEERIALAKMLDMSARSVQIW
jgi:hypothetical protein